MQRESRTPTRRNFNSFVRDKSPFAESYANLPRVSNWLGPPSPQVWPPNEETAPMDSFKLRENYKLNPIQMYLADRKTKESLKIYFESYRRIPVTSNNILICLSISILDYSATYSDQNFIVKIGKSLKTAYSDVDMKVSNIFTRIKQTIGSYISVPQKLNILNKIYVDENYFLILLMRKCLCYYTEKLYTKKKYRDLSHIKSNSISIIKEKILDYNDGLDWDYYRILLDSFNIKLKKISLDDLSVFDINDFGEYIFYLIEEESSFNVLYTTVDHHLRIRDDSSALVRFIENKKAFLKDSKADLELQAADKERLEAGEVFYNIMSQVYPNWTLNYVVEYFRSLYSEELITKTIKDYYCSYCGAFSKTTRVECGHRLCSVHFVGPAQPECVICCPGY